MKILLPGLYPRSEKLVAATRDYDRERVSLDQLQKARADDAIEFKKLQKGFSYLSTGQFNWQDLLRPIADIVPSAKVGPLTRFFETNTFWKKLEFEGEAKLDEKKLESWMKQYFFGDGLYDKNDSMIITLPFLYLFHEYSSGISMDSIAALLEKIIKPLLSLPNKIICFYEPVIGWRPLGHEEKRTGKVFIDRLKSHSKTPLIIYSSFFSIQNDSSFLFDLPVDGYGIDFYANPLSLCLKRMPKNKILLAGVISTQSTAIEPREKIYDFIGRLKDAISPDNLYLTTSGPAELIPRTVMDEKVKNLAAMN